MGQPDFILYNLKDGTEVEVEPAEGKRYIVRYIMPNGLPNAIVYDEMEKPHPAIDENAKEAIEALVARIRNN